VYAPGATTASRTILLPSQGANSVDTEFNAMTVDAAGDVYVALLSNEIRVFGPTATGAATPLRPISGALTTLGGGLVQGVSQLAVDATGNLYVAEGDGYAGSKVVMFGPAATGNVAPVLVTGPAYLPNGVALDTAGNIYISQSQASAFVGGFVTGIFEFPAGSVAGATPMKSISGTSAGFGAYLHDIQVDAAGNIFVLEYLGSVQVFGATATGNTSAAETMILTRGASTDTQFYLR
jgi:hypothetical protein